MLMQRRSDGISLREIAEEFEVQHRTAQRMRDAVERLFHDLEEVPCDTKEKRWRLAPGRLERLVGLSAQDLSSLEIAEQRLRRESLVEEADRLKSLGLKLKTVMRPLERNRIETDLEFLSENEVFAAKPGPMALLADGIYDQLKEAVLRSQRIKIVYRSRKGEDSSPVLEPYGFLLGHRHYLVAINPGKDSATLKNYTLSRISSVELLPTTFIRDDSIDLKKYAERSFGIFVEDEGPVEVIWRFSPTATESARDFRFHPTEIKEEEHDGSLLVKFTAGGLIEMAWHLLMWGDHVEVIKPDKLRELVAPLKLKWDALP